MKPGNKACTVSKRAELRGHAMLPRKFARVWTTIKLDLPLGTASAQSSLSLLSAHPSLYLVVLVPTNLRRTGSKSSQPIAI